MIMKKIVKIINKFMQGSFLLKEPSEKQIVKEINDSLKQLDYYGSEFYKKNMKEDVASFNRDFNKATKEAKIKFEPAL